jgi:1-phosphatidylinositol-3-phosphate 5-kinase
MDEQADDAGRTTDIAERMARTVPRDGDAESRIEDTPADATENEADFQGSSHAPSDNEERSDVDDASEEIYLPDSPEDLLRMSQEDIDLKELPKHERTSLMKMLTNFWAERSSSGWIPLEYPLGASEHIFADCDIIVREDEPSSIIAFALDSQDYKTMLQDMQNRPPQDNVAAAEFGGHVHPDDQHADVMHSLLRKTGTHLKYQFQEGPAKMLCKIFFAEQFDAVRRKCGVADRMVESLSRCFKWDSKGGKTKSLFLKTLDNRFVLKSLSPIETQSFLKFAPNYFQIMSEAFFHELPSVIAKMLGFYQIIVKNTVTGLEYNWFLIAMENLFYDRIPTRIFDLKGSMRNRKINATGEKNEVLLDENMVEFIYESPLFVREHSKKLLRSSVHNDTLFLARQNVMDYSLMVAIDENRKELVVGIIDCIRTYTWDKKLESWIKDRGFARGGKNRPTVTSPKEYKRRFREAMNRYVLEAPDCWHQFKPVRIERKTLRFDGDPDGDKGENEVQILA